MKKLQILFVNDIAFICALFIISVFILLFGPIRKTIELKQVYAVRPGEGKKDNHGRFYIIFHDNKHNKDYKATANSEMTAKALTCYPLDPSLDVKLIENGKDFYKVISVSVHNKQVAGLIEVDAEKPSKS